MSKSIDSEKSSKSGKSSKSDKSDEMTQEQHNMRFFQFLARHKVEEGDYTHTCFGPPWGKYYIEDKDYKKFLSLYHKVIGHEDLHVTERQKKVGPILIDLDFRISAKNKERQYTSKNIKDIVVLYTETIKKYLKYDASQLKAIVYEKAEPTIDHKQGNVKDGFHIVYPIPVSSDIRHFIFDEVKNIVMKEKLIENVPYINTFDDIFDSAVIERNVWMLHGSKKETGSLYRVTNIYDSECKKTKDKLTIEELVNLAAIRQFEESDAWQLKDDYNNEETKGTIYSIYDKYTGVSRKMSKLSNTKTKTDTKKKYESDDGGEYDGEGASDEEASGKHDDEETVDDTFKKLKRLEAAPPTTKYSDADVARKLAKALSPKRAEPYYEWVCVGWALHNVSEDLLDAFIEFSKKCPTKYKEGCCEKVWEEARDHGFTIASLYHWAKKDNPKEFEKIIQQNVNKLIEEAETGSHDDIAKVVYEMYKHQYRCVSISKHKWYGFHGHRWKFIDEAYTLHNKLSDEITKEYARLASKYYLESSTKNGTDRDKLVDKASHVSRVIERLKNEGFKSAVISSCAKRFFDDKFEEKLDDNPHLLGFENGVFDLKNGHFREGSPDDYITLTTKYSYVKYKPTDTAILEIKRYFSQVMREEEMCNYLLTLMASYLDGVVRNQKFVIWTGSGSNSKSTVVDLFKFSMGEYFGVLPTTVLTRKRGNASNATPELADKRGKRCLIIQEPEHDDTVYVGQMKNLTGADWITARALYGNMFEFKPQFKLILICNKLPNIPANDGGTWRRIRVSPFESEFLDPDKMPAHPKPYQFLKDLSLTEKLPKWKSAFMWLLLNEYYPEYRRTGTLKEPKKVTQFTDKYKQDSDIFYEYMREDLIETGSDDNYIRIPEVYASFRNWYKEAHNATAPPRKELINYFTSHTKLRIDGGNIYGIKFKLDGDYDEGAGTKKKKKAPAEDEPEEHTPEDEEKEDDEEDEEIENDSEEDDEIAEEIEKLKKKKSKSKKKKSDSDDSSDVEDDAISLGIRSRASSKKSTKSAKKSVSGK